MLKKRSVFLSWLLSYMLILFVPIFIGAVVYEKAEKTVEYEINHSNRIMMEQSQQALDDGLEEIIRVINQIELNGKFKQLMNVDRQAAYTDYYDKVMQGINDFKYYKVLTSYANDFFIYLNNIDRIFTGSGLLDKDVFFNSKLENNGNYAGMTDAEFAKLLQGDYSGEYMTWGGDRTLDDDLASNGLVYSVTLPLNEKKDPRATLVIMLNYKKIQGIIQSVQSADNGWGVIVDEDNRVLFSTTNFKSLPLELSYENHFNEQGVTYANVNGEKLVVSYTDSEIVKWRYISVIPRSIFWEKVDSIRRLTVICTILCIILGLLMAFFLAWKNYTPINKLLSALSIKAKITPSKGFNEYKFIQEAISNNIVENMNIREKLNQQTHALRSVFLTKLMKGKVENTDYITNALSSYNMKFESDYFAVVIFYMIDFETLFENYYQVKSSDEKIALARFIIINIFEEQVAQANNGYAAEVDEMIVCLINFRNVENGKLTLHKAVNEAHAFISSKFRINVIAAISDIHRTYFGISEAYHEALDAIEYQIAMGNKEITSYDDLKRFGGKYNYSIKTENRLINCIKAGDFENCTKLLDEIFDSSFSQSHLPKSLIKCMMFGLANTMLKAMMEISYIIGEELIDGLNIADRLLKCEKVQEMKNEMNDILQQVCIYIERNKTGKGDQLVDSIVAYIEDNYHDVNLSVAMIAEKLNLTPAYLTKLYKERMGEGIFDYISKKRIEKAKIMLQDPNMNVKDVAEKVGYFNSNVFIRAFKKNAGVTPGRYK